MKKITQGVAARSAGLIFGLIALTGMGISVSAARFTSTNYIVDASVANNFGGQGSSSSYGLVSSGGESIIGNGSSGSYKLGAGYVAQLTNSSIQLTVQPSGLKAYYPLDENAGTTTADGSSYRHSGTLQGNATWSGTGQIGSAVDMGTNGSISVPYNTDLPSGNALTTEAWVKESAWSSQVAIASHWNYATSGSWAFQTGTNNNLRILLATSQTDTGTTYVDTAANTWTSFGTWRHVVMTYDGTQAQASMVKVYIDGTLVASSVTGVLPSALQGSSGAFSIGSFPGLGRNFNGAIDQVKLFSRALTSGEVGAEYAAQVAGVPSGMGIGTVTPNVSMTNNYDAIVQTTASGYGLTISQNHDLQSGVNTIPAVGGTIASPLAWVEGSTKGVGFTLTGSTVAGSVPAKWNNGNSYAAFPAAGSSFYSRTGASGTSNDVLNLRIRADVSGAQAPGTYANTVTYTATTTP
jgi:hypothetical protein